ncbi:gastrula zinc finger protein XlCGF26.1-like isoform X1 [Diorhabda sublineata]|uniref:gastrula zinc finger protein XlCGF26.1-like isoform X1 n=2 Tax=Diorhabda sublineata TaxID=1163346 RepID=UPI0024E16E43|nr:gastrula zinc finger protein XlCGF26.1-like isoform X1 [Diorhabda sublineata]
MDSRCRLCAECTTEQISILQDAVFCLKIFQLFQIKVSITDHLPTFVCRECYEMVEKTWSFNDRIQKAQDILANILNTIQNMVLVPTNSEIDHSVVIHSDIGSMVELDYISENNKSQFLNEDNLDIFDVTSVKSESEPTIKNATGWKKRKVRNSRNEVRKGLRKKFNSNTQLENIEFEVRIDGTMAPKDDNNGWNTYPFSCAECQQICGNPDDLKDHYATAHKLPPRYSCADCSKGYSKYSVFLAHARVHRSKLKLCCDLCYKWFPTAAEQNQHRSQHREEKPHICNTCGKKFRIQSSLVVHTRSHLPAELKNQYQCDQCPKRFGTKPNLMAHKRIHSGIRDYTCDQCGKSFVQKGNLDNHLLTHTAARPFTCVVCEKTFKTLVRLRKHSSVHSGLKPHRCNICGRQFRERGTLKEHERIHTGAMPFTCEFCGKCFRFKGVLTTHRRQHTGERPYSCNECQHHFTNWPNYNKHMKRRHGINTSVTCRTRQDIPPTGMPHRNPPGTVLAAPQPVIVQENFVEQPPTFYPVLNLYNIPEELLQRE